MIATCTKEPPFIKRFPSSYSHHDMVSNDHVPSSISESARIVLCVSSETARHPELIGLTGENLTLQPWLYVCCDAQEVRAIAQEGFIGEIWVSGSNTVSGINLAATLKSDCPNICVKLIDFDPTGSLCSRAQAAGIDEIYGRHEFVDAYINEKARSHAPSEKWTQDCACQDNHGTDDLSDTQKLVAIMPEENAQLHVSAAENHSEKLPPVDDQHVPETTESDVHCDPFSCQEESIDEPSDVGTSTHYGQPDAHCEKHASGKHGSLLCVVGAGGGVGKSTISALIAYVLQSQGKHVAILDADFQFGDLHYLCGEEHPIRADELIHMPERFEALDTHMDTPLLVAAPLHVENSEVASTHVVELAKQLCTKFDAVVVNTGSMWNDVQIKLLDIAAVGLFVIDQRPSSIRTCRRALDLCSRCGVASQSFLFVANRCSRNALFSSIDVSCAMNGAHAAEIKDGGKEVEEMLGLGRPAELLTTRNPLVESLFELAQTEFPPALQISVPDHKKKVSKRRRKKHLKSRHAQKDDHEVSRMHAHTHPDHISPFQRDEFFHKESLFQRR